MKAPNSDAYIGKAASINVNVKNWKDNDGGWAYSLRPQRARHQRTHVGDINDLLSLNEDNFLFDLDQLERKGRG